MAFTYTLSKVKSEALHWVRWRIGATKETRSKVDDEEIDAALTGRGLTTTSDPASNFDLVHRAAADVCRAIAADLGYDSQIAITDVGPIKSNSAQFFLRLAKELEDAITQKRQLQLEGPSEEIDSVDYTIGDFGKDESEFVGDVVV